MVRDPELLRRYISSDGFSLDEVCIKSRRLGFPCIPSIDDDFKTRLIAVSITFLTVLTMELESMGTPSSIDGIAALLGDISSDLAIYGAPRDVIDEAHELMRRIAIMARLVKTPLDT
ncbi:hypothetical protein GCM10007981_06390 [Thermocladium modestius]|uniref:Uncharacterized protein n=2 Tax=Thermocladium modestius TaxID=62609 RepID=A0A830GUX1_9CREN|nr:hypothetical protein GCM10007981_06390 [Thermocladium modestius]